MSAVLRVVRGDPAPEELAALLAVLAATGGRTTPVGASRRTAWNHPARLVRAPVQAGPGGWRASALPR